MSKLKVFNSILEFQHFRKTLSGSVGFVPTMGALHNGHASLMKKSSNENDFSVLSIYVNPTQFNNPTDLEKYPKTYEEDLKLAAECGINAVVSPQYSEIYEDNYRYKLTESKFSQILCGANRPGHFDGVLTIVMKLFNIVQPTKAYFGEKDFQQLKLIEDMVKSFFMPVDVVRCKTLREESGLAMSSRNKRLSPDGLKKAALIFKTITLENSVDDVKNTLIKNDFKIDYVADIDGRRFIAAILEDVRLIDNVEI
jgi:pantoate--beta-alanine ligase